MDNLEAPPKHVGPFEWKWKNWLWNLYIYVRDNVKKDFYFEVARGSINGHSSRHIFGRNPDVSTAYETVWNTGGTQTLLAAASTMSVVSTSANDTAAGTGVQSVEIHGLDANYEEQAVIVNLNGLTSVVTTETFIRVFQIHAHSVGSAGAAVGTITAKDTGAVTHISITAGQTTSLAAVYTIPANKTGYLYYGKMSSSAGKSVILRFSYILFATGVKEAAHIVDAYEHAYDYFFQAPIVLPEKTDLTVEAVSSASGTSISAGFSLILVNN